MSEIILRKLNINDEAAFVNALTEWGTNTGFTWLRSYTPGVNFSEYLEKLRGFEKGQGLAPGTVPDSSLFAFLGSEIVGRVSIRHELNDFLQRVGGHIGYGVLPRFRRRGYAKKMLAMALPYARQVGIRKALLTCDDDNEGSIKVIEANGGVLENKISDSDGKSLKRRYWINL